MSNIRNKSTLTILSFRNYYSFGMVMPGRSFVSESYRYGFNGKEKDPEGMGGGSAVR